MWKATQIEQESNHSTKPDVEKRGNLVLRMIRDPFWPSIIITSVQMSVLLLRASLCLFFKYWLWKTLMLHLKRKPTLLALMDTEKTLKAWLESMFQHTPTGWKPRCQAKGTPTLLSILLMSVPYPWLEPKRFKRSKLFFCSSYKLVGSCFQDLSPAVRIWNVLKMGDKHLLELQKCGSWCFIKWTKPKLQDVWGNHSGAMLWQGVPYFGHIALVSF